MPASDLPWPGDVVTTDVQPMVPVVAVAGEAPQRWLLQGSSGLLLAASERRGGSWWGTDECST